MASTVDQSQSGIVDAFESGALTGGPRPARIDTHLSHVFLTPELAYKLKRAVKLPFVDFSTAQRRRAACDNELAINRRQAPALYLRVEDVTRTGDGRLTLGGEGNVIDSVVVMKRFRDADLFDRMARDGRLTRALVEYTARAIAVFHSALEPVQRSGETDRLATIIAQLEETEREGVARLGAQRIGAPLFGALRGELDRRHAMIASRRSAGKIRRGHGDLHLGNICLFEGVPTLFDAIEFSDDIATCDVLYDFAFLLMDLEHRGQRSLANAALNRYFDTAREDESALVLLPLFMALRATVRMAVLTQSGDLPQAVSYRDLGAEILAPQTTRLVAIGGLSGTGKSAAARELASALPGACGGRILRSDVLRKEVYNTGGGAPVSYTAHARRDVYARLMERVQDALEGASVIADATFQETAARDAVEAAVPPQRLLAIWLTAPLAVRTARVTSRRGDVSDADAKIAATQQEPSDLSAAWHIVDASGTPGETLQRIQWLIAPAKSRA